MSVGIFVIDMIRLLMRFSIVLNVSLIMKISIIGILGKVVNRVLVLKVVRFRIDLIDRLMLWVMMMIVLLMVIIMKIVELSRRFLMFCGVRNCGFEMLVMIMSRVRVVNIENLWERKICLIVWLMLVCVVGVLSWVVM